MFCDRDYGLERDHRSDSRQAVRAAIQAAISSRPGAEVVLDEGVYRVKPLSPQHTCFAILHATNLVVRGAGKSTQIVISDPASGEAALCGVNCYAPFAGNWLNLPTLGASQEQATIWT